VNECLSVCIDPRKPRARDLGIPFDGSPGKYNAITDVKGVEVGFSTIIQGDSVRTGVTAIFPRGTDYTTYKPPCFANWFSLNGNGEMTGIHWLTETGFLPSPILITNTNDVGMCRDSMIKWFLMKNDTSPMFDMDDVSLPVVAETWDGYLNDIYGFHVKENHVFEALDNAKEAGPFVQEGNVGGGTGMICFNFKAGTGTSSRIVEGSNYTLGVLVQANFGRKKQLTIAGVPVGKELLQMELNSPSSEKDAGSIIVILATDAPLLPHQLKRLATRVSLGVGKLGGIGADSSGDIFLAFSTAYASDATSTTKTATFLSNTQINPLFDATIQCTEEAILNAMIAAETMIGHQGHTVEAISHENVIEILKKYNRFEGTSNYGVHRVYFLPLYQIIILFTLFYYLSLSLV
jgi:D-aminopeptidase